MLHSLFPTAVYQVNLGTLAQSDCIDIANELAQYRPQMQGTTSDIIGLSQLHLDPRLQELFRAIEHHSRLYVNQLGYAQQNFEFWATKTWIVDSDSHSDSVVGEHTHPSSDLSAVYYALHDGTAPLEFLNANQPNELFGGGNIHDWPVRRGYTEYNCQSRSLQAQPGDLILFPSKLAHRVAQRPQSRRISLSTDILMAIRSQLRGREFTRNSPETWKKLDSR